MFAGVQWGQEMRNWVAKMGCCSKKESKSIFEASRQQSTRNWCYCWRNQSHLREHELAKGPKKDFLRHFHLFNQYLLRDCYVPGACDKDWTYIAINKADKVLCPCGADKLAGERDVNQKNHTCTYLCGKKDRSMKFSLRKWHLGRHLRNEQKLAWQRVEETLCVFLLKKTWSHKLLW